MDIAREISDTIGQSLGDPVDEDELEAELAQLEAEDLDDQLQTINAPAAGLRSTLPPSQSRAERSMHGSSRNMTRVQCPTCRPHNLCVAVRPRLSRRMTKRPNCGRWRRAWPSARASDRERDRLLCVRRSRWVDGWIEPRLLVAAVCHPLYKSRHIPLGWTLSSVFVALKRGVDSQSIGEPFVLLPEDKGQNLCA